MCKLITAGNKKYSINTLFVPLKLCVILTEFFGYGVVKNVD